MKKKKIKVALQWNKDLWDSGEKQNKITKVCTSQCLSKCLDLYIPEVSLGDSADLKEANLQELYSSSGHYTALELIETFKEFLEETLPDPIISPYKYKACKELIKECSNWVEDECETVLSE